MAVEEWSAGNKVNRLSRSVVLFSPGMIVAEVNDVVASFCTKISAVKETPTTVGGSLVVGCTIVDGR